MYHETGKLDKEERRALTIINGELSGVISIRLLQDLSTEGLIILNQTIDNSKLTTKGIRALNQ